MKTWRVLNPKIGQTMGNQRLCWIQANVEAIPKRTGNPRKKRT